MNEKSRNEIKTLQMTEKTISEQLIEGKH